MTSVQKFPLSACQFKDEDDLSYLKDDNTWIESRADRLHAVEKEALFALVLDLHKMDKAILNKKFLYKVLQNRFDNDYNKKLIADKRKNLVRAIFTAAVTREVILKTETAESMRKNRDSFLDEFPFLKDQEGTDEELTWLNRYVRALKILSEITERDKKMTMMMNVAAHLQGSDVFTEYVTGGANKPATERRVRLHHMIVDYTPKKRPPRNYHKESTVQVGVKRGRGRPRKNSESPSNSVPTGKKVKTTHNIVDEFTLTLDVPSSYDNVFDFCSSSSEDDHSHFFHLQDVFISDKTMSEHFDNEEDLDSMCLDLLLDSMDDEN